MTSESDSHGCGGLAHKVLALWRKCYSDARLLDTHWAAEPHCAVALVHSLDFGQQRQRRHGRPSSAKHSEGTMSWVDSCASLSSLSLSSSMDTASCTDETTTATDKGDKRRPAVSMSMALLNGLCVRSPLTAATGTFTSERVMPDRHHHKDSGHKKHCSSSSSSPSSSSSSSSECTKDNHRDKGVWVNLYRACVPDLPGAHGQRSSAQVYVKALEAAGLDVAASACLFTGLCWPLGPGADAQVRVITHQNVGLDPVEFARRTLVALCAVEHAVKKRIERSKRVATAALDQLDDEIDRLRHRLRRACDRNPIKVPSHAHAASTPTAPRSKSAHFPVPASSEWAPEDSEACVRGTDRGPQSTAVSATTASESVDLGRESASMAARRAGGAPSARTMARKAVQKSVARAIPYPKQEYETIMSSPDGCGWTSTTTLSSQSSLLPTAAVRPFEAHLHGKGGTIPSNPSTRSTRRRRHTSGSTPVALDDGSDSRAHQRNDFRADVVMSDHCHDESHCATYRPLRSTGTTCTVPSSDSAKPTKSDCRDRNPTTTSAGSGGSTRGSVIHMSKRHKSPCAAETATGTTVGRSPSPSSLSRTPRGLNEPRAPERLPKHRSRSTQRPTRARTPKRGAPMDERLWCAHHARWECADVSCATSSDMWSSSSSSSSSDSILAIGTVDTTVSNPWSMGTADILAESAQETLISSLERSSKQVDGAATDGGDGDDAMPTAAGLSSSIVCESGSRPSLSSSSSTSLSLTPWSSQMPPSLSSSSSSSDPSFCSDGLQSLLLRIINGQHPATAPFMAGKGTATVSAADRGPIVRIARAYPAVDKSVNPSSVAAAADDTGRALDQAAAAADPAPQGPAMPNPEGREIPALPTVSAQDDNRAPPKEASDPCQCSDCCRTSSAGNGPDDGSSSCDCTSCMAVGALNPSTDPQQVQQ